MQARNVLCVLHDRPAVVREICAAYPGFEYDEDYSTQGRDERMPRAFRIAADSNQPTLTADDLEATDGHQDVAYVLSPRLTPETAVDGAARALRFVTEALGHGARAVKCESAGLAHGRERWIELGRRVAAVSESGVYAAWVRRPIGNDAVNYSCGMHLLGLPDVEVVGVTPAVAIEMIDAFAFYLLVDRPGDRLRPGHKFRASVEDERYRLELTPCDRYAADDFFHNPHGYWRLTRSEE